MDDLPGIVAGTTKPVGPPEMRAILQRFLPRIHEETEKALELRKRTLAGETQIRRLRSQKEQGIPTDVTDADLTDAEARLEGLKLSLRGSEAWVVTGLALALAEGVGALLGEAGKKEGWKPPEGSMLRIVLPGLLNLSVNLHDQDYPKANP